MNEKLKKLKKPLNKNKTSEYYQKTKENVATKENKKKFETLVLLGTYIYLIYVFLMIAAMIIFSFLTGTEINYMHVFIYLFIEALIVYSLKKNDNILLLFALMMTKLIY